MAMPVSEKIEIEAELKNLDVEYIVSDGYFTNKDGGDKLQSHTTNTLKLYIDGLNCRGSVKDADIYNGVPCVNYKPLAEWDVDGEVQYFKL